MIFFGAGKLGDLGGALRRGIDNCSSRTAGIGQPDQKDDEQAG